MKITFLSTLALMLDQWRLHMFGFLAEIKISQKKIETQLSTTSEKESQTTMLTTTYTTPIKEISANMLLKPQPCSLTEVLE